MRCSVSYILFIVSTVILYSCKDPLVEPQSSFPGFVVPSHFPAPNYSGAPNNPITKEGFELGRKIFYDPITSKDSTISCGSCHQSFAAFANLDHATSHGIDGLFGTRNAPPIQNTAWMNSFMWDGGINHIEVMPLAPLTNPVEHNETINNILVKLNRQASYREQFQQVFKSSPITDQQMFYAFSQFMTMMVSSNSKYDEYIKGNMSALTSDEVEGLQLFNSKCSACHTGILFTDGSFRNNGLTPTSIDSGRMHITNFEMDRNKFKVPSLRNIALSRPYMHDGRFNTLEKVLNHYSDGVVDSPTLDPLLKSNGNLGISLTDEEKQKIILFLQTLTDYTFVNNPLFQQP
ncbi:MAG: cytochrome c peroxidase [Cytophagaceae bacterium]